jgi:anaerobic ribonucleoside-triphosphate reductase activating protein
MLLLSNEPDEMTTPHSPDFPVSSPNQRVHVFNPAFQDCISWASDQIKIHVLKDGTRIITGFRGQLGDVTF